MVENEQNTEQTRVSELEGLLAKQGEELDQANARLAESERIAAEAGEQLKGAVLSYRGLIEKTNPEVPAELLAGETIEALDNSLVKAKELITKVKSGLEAQSVNTRIPAGAPQRGGVVP